MAGPYRSTTPAELVILEPAYRHYFSLPARVREGQTCVEETSTRFVECGSDRPAKWIAMWFKSNRTRRGVPEADLLPSGLSPAGENRPGGLRAVNDWLQRFSNRQDALEKTTEERHLFLLSRLELYPKGQVGRAALLVGRTHLPLGIVADPSFRAFMRESAARYRHPSIAELQNAVLRIAHQFRLEFTPTAEQGRLCNLMVDAATSGAEPDSASACRLLVLAVPVND
jgi:hypothetical protein